MYSYLAILEKKEISKSVLKKYFAEQGIKLDKFYSSIGIIRLISKKKLNVSKLKYISALEIDRKEFSISEEEKHTNKNIDSTNNKL